MGVVSHAALTERRAKIEHKQYEQMLCTLVPHVTTLPGVCKGPCAPVLSHTYLLSHTSQAPAAPVPLYYLIPTYYLIPAKHQQHTSGLNAARVKSTQVAFYLYVICFLRLLLKTLMCGSLSAWSPGNIAQLRSRCTRQQACMIAGSESVQVLIFGAPRGA